MFKDQSESFTWEDLGLNVNMLYRNTRNKNKNEARNEEQEEIREQRISKKKETEEKNRKRIRKAKKLRISDFILYFFSVPIHLFMDGLHQLLTNYNYKEVKSTGASSDNFNRLLPNNF